MNKEMLKEYGRMAVIRGVNIQKGQTLIINAPIFASELVHYCAEAAYNAGAKEVVVHYSDETLSRIKMERTDIDTLCDVKPWIQNSYLEYIKSDGGAALLAIIGSDPEIYKGIDSEKVNKSAVARAKALAEYREYTMASRIQWCIVAIPTPKWSAKVFPEMSAEEAEEKLWNTIFRVSRAEGDAVANWIDYSQKARKRRDIINSLNLTEVQFTSSNGTDLHVGLADDCLWGGVSEYSEKGIEFIPNMPTEEIFTAPHKDRVNGIVYGTKPYVYNGDLIEKFWLKFENGKVVDYGAEKGAELLKALLETDEGSKSLGEVALVPASSPINRENVLFYNTLFDENARCHIALGESYPGTVKGGEKMTKDELLRRGANQSVVHEDLMIGSFDTCITGITKDGKEIQIFTDGEWIF